MKLTIKPREDDDRHGRKGRRLTGNDYHYILTNKEGDELEVTTSLVRLELSMGLREASHSKMEFLLDDVDVDAEFLAEMEAHLEQKRADEEDELTQDARGG